MAITQERVTAPLLTYDAYMNEGEIQKRYDIIDGVREYMSPTRRHQREMGYIWEQFIAYEPQAQKGQAIMAPSDVFIRRSPLRTRQPDVLFISNGRLAQNAPADVSAPLDPAPELVVEILSPSDTRSVLSDKIADYCTVDVQECWVVSPKAQTVEVLELSRNGSQSIATYGMGQNVVSLTFPDLSVPVNAIFK